MLAWDGQPWRRNLTVFCERVFPEEYLVCRHGLNRLHSSQTVVTLSYFLLYSFFLSSIFYYFLVRILIISVAIVVSNFYIISFTLVVTSDFARNQVTTSIDSVF